MSMSTVKTFEAITCAMNTIALRDEFAGKIAAAFCGGPEGGVNPVKGKDASWQDATARTGYEVADAMLKARTA